MSNLNDQISSDLKDAMRAKDTLALTVIRALKSANKNAAIEKGGADAVLDDPEILAVVRKQVKQRQESFESFTSAGRGELAEKEQAEIAILEKYLPTPLTDEEIEKFVEEAVVESGAESKAQMGAVMKLVQEKTGGRADGKTLSQAVMKRLS